MGNDKKPFWKSKGKIGAILMAIGAVGGYLAGQMDIAATIIAITAALSIFGIRDRQG